MEKEDLIKKLENIEIPEVEIPSHKRWLKMALINWMDNQKDKGRIFAWFKKPLIPLGSAAVIILICFIVNNLFIPQYTLADATEIALNNPQIYGLLKEGNEIKDIKILKDKAYILISPEKYKEVKDEKIYSSLAEIELKRRKVSKIEEVSPEIIPLTQIEEEKVNQIIQTIELLKTPSKIIKIEVIKPSPIFPSNLEIIKQKEIKTSSGGEKDRLIYVIYKINSTMKEGKINLTTEKMEEIKILEKGF